MGLLIALVPACWAQLPDPTLSPAQQTITTQLDFPAVSGFDVIRGAFAWPTAEADYPLGLSRTYIRRHRIRQFTFRGAGSPIGSIAREPGDMIWGHDLRRQEEEPSLAPFDSALLWRFRYAYDSNGSLLEAEGHRQDLDCPVGSSNCRSQTAGWRVRKRYDDRQRLIELSLNSYDRLDKSPDTLLSQTSWQRRLLYDTSGHLQQLVERMQYKDFADSTHREEDWNKHFRTRVYWGFTQFHYDAQHRLTAVHTYNTRDSTGVRGRQLVGRVLYCYDTQGRVAQILAFSNSGYRLPPDFTDAEQRRFTYRRGRVASIAYRTYDVTFSDPDTLSFCSPVLREDTTTRRPLISGARYFSVSDIRRERYDAQSRLAAIAYGEDGHLQLKREYHRRYVLETDDHNHRARLLLLGRDGQVTREVEVSRLDAYDKFNENPSRWGDEPTYTDAEKYGWRSTDTRTRRLLKQWRFTVVDRRFRYDAAGLPQELVLYDSRNRQAVRPAGSEAPDDQLTAYLLEPTQWPQAKGLRRIIRQYSGWPYHQSTRQRFGSFRYEYY